MLGYSSAIPIRKAEIKYFINLNDEITVPWILLAVRSVQQHLELNSQGEDIEPKKRKRYAYKSIFCWFHRSSFKGFPIVFPAS